MPTTIIISLKARMHRPNLAEKPNPVMGLGLAGLPRRGPSRQPITTLYSEMKTSLRDAARQHHIPYSTLLSWVKGGKIPAEETQRGNRANYQIEESELARFLATRKDSGRPKGAPVFELDSQSPQVPDVAVPQDPASVHHPPAGSASREPSSPGPSKAVPAGNHNARPNVFPHEDSDPPWDPEPTAGGTSAANRRRRKNPVNMVKNSMRSLDLEQLFQVEFWLINRIKSKSATSQTEVSAS